VVEQEVRGRRHVAMLAERHDEVRPCAVEHRAVIREHGQAAERRRALGGHGRIGVLQTDELDVVAHLREQAEIGGVVQRVPVADADGRDAGARHFLSFTSSYGPEYANPGMAPSEDCSIRGPTPFRNASCQMGA